MAGLLRNIMIGMLIALIPTGLCRSVTTVWTHVGQESVLASLNRCRAIRLPDFELTLPSEVALISDASTGGEYTPDLPAIILFSNDCTGFDPDGSYHLIQEEAIKILNEQGASDHRIIRLDYDLPYDRTRILNAFVVRPDGVTVAVTPEHIRDVSNSDDMDVNIFEPIWRSIVISFPDIQPGSVIYWAYETVSIQPRTPGSFQWGHTFRTTLPIRSASIRIMGPSSVPLYWDIENEDAVSTVFSQSDAGDDLVLYEWRSGPADAIEIEPDMIPVQELMTSLHVSTDTWQTYSDREAAFIEPNLVPDEAIRDKVIELTASLDDHEAILETLFMYVTKRVRYMGVTFGDRPGVNPDPITRTFTNNAGVCKDKAGLLTAMLRVAGIEACYTLNNPEMRVFRDVAVDQFNHAIVSARLPDQAEWRYLDVTVDLARSMIPATSGGTQVLRITPGGADLETIPLFSPEMNRGQFTFTSNLDANGQLRSSVFYTGEGAADHFYRESLYYLDKSLWRSYFMYWMSRLSLHAVITHVSALPDNMEDLSEALSIQFGFSIPDYAVRADRFMLFKMPAAQSPFDWFFDDIREISGVQERQHPVYIGQASRMTTREELELPAGYCLAALPNDVMIRTPYLGFTQSWSEKDRMLVLDQESIVYQPRVPEDDYAEFRKTFRRIRQAMETYVVLEKKP